MEEIVGNILDEYDEEELITKQQTEAIWQTECWTWKVGIFWQFLSKEK